MRGMEERPVVSSWKALAMSAASGLQLEAKTTARMVVFFCGRRRGLTDIAEVMVWWLSHWREEGRGSPLFVIINAVAL